MGNNESIVNFIWDQLIGNLGNFVDWIWGFFYVFGGGFLQKKIYFYWGNRADVLIRDLGSLVENWKIDSTWVFYFIIN